MPGEYPARQPICKIPLVAGGKVPLVVRWSSLSVDDPIWEETFRNHPGCNVGYRLDGLLVVDCDSPAAVAWWLERGFPTDFVSRGREERRTYWYRLPGDSDPPRPGKLRPDVDLKWGAGHQCVVPPSVHPCGRAYEWLGEKVDEVSWWEVPGAPVEEIAALAAERPLVAAGGGWSVVEAGGRDNFLMAVAGSLRRQGICEDGIREGVAALNQLYCLPPKRSADVERIARSAARYDTEVVLLMDDDGPRLTSRKTRYRRILR
jgi:hypothetical protein